MDYYQASKKASQHVLGHPGLVYLKTKCKTAKKILDVGCGEGTRLNVLLPKGKVGWGLDINPAAISMAKSAYPKNIFQLGSAEDLPYQDSTFDLVYSAFAIEHCSNPQNFVNEMFRVCKSGGVVVILTPNYGAPNRRSPVSVQNPYAKFFAGAISDFFPSSTLKWTKVVPRKKYTQPDDDTTFEPYLLSLVKYIRTMPNQIISASSLWELEPASDNFRKRLIRFLGNLGIPPFCYWGPQLFIAALKT